MSVTVFKTAAIGHSAIAPESPRLVDLRGTEDREAPPGLEPGIRDLQSLALTNLATAPWVLQKSRPPDSNGDPLAGTRSEERARLPVPPGRLHEEDALGSWPRKRPGNGKRTGEDSNLRGLSPTRFPIVRHKPLGHPSLGTSRTIGELRSSRPGDTERAGFEPARIFIQRLSRAPP